jgi:hypothetical protein
MCI